MKTLAHLKDWPTEADRISMSKTMRDAVGQALAALLSNASADYVVGDDATTDKKDSPQPTHRRGIVAVKQADNMLQRLTKLVICLWHT